MALTRGDKTIILGAVALAVTVVLGLAILKKPFLFSGGPKTSAADIPPAPTAASAPVAGEPVPPQPAPPVSVQAPVQVPVQVPATPPAPSPSVAVPDAPAAAPAASAPAKPGPVPSVAGDETLEKMFAEIAGDPVPAGKTTDVKAAPGHGPDADAGHNPASAAEPKAAPAAAPEPAPAPVVAETPAAPAAKPLTKAEQKAQARQLAKEKAKAAAEAKAAAAPPAAASKPATPAKAPAKAATVPGAAPAKAGSAGGNVIRVVADEKPGEYILVVHTSKPVGTASKLFMTDPPRLVLDVAGAWTYTGPLSSVTGNDFIRQIRIGKHPDMFRVVLDMAPDATTRLRGAPTVERVPEGVALRIPK